MEKHVTPDFESIWDLIKKIERKIQGPIKPWGFATGFKFFDQCMSGLHPSDLTLIASRPGMGKSALALNMAAHLALRENVKTHFYSSNDTKERILMKIISAEIGVDKMRLLNGMLNTEDIQALLKVTGELGNAPLEIQSITGTTIGELHCLIRSLSETGTRVVFVDSLQLIKDDTYDQPDTRYQLLNLTRQLKETAMSFGISIVALINETYTPELTGDYFNMKSVVNSPMMNLHADNLIWLFWPERILRENTPESMIGKANIELLKNRNGPFASYYMHFNQSIQKFSEPK